MVDEPLSAEACRAIQLPCSKSRANQLGEKLAAGEPLTDPEAALLDDVLLKYQDAQELVAEQLERLGYRPTVRVKTTGTLTEKLRRLRDQRLVRIDDIAGARIVVQGSRRAQDEAVARVVQVFTIDGNAPRVKDRREDPSHGYRAVHVLTVIGDCRVEIQIRTWLQDLWAQVVEGLGDRWGREVRYGQPIVGGDTCVVPGLATTRTDVVEACAILSEVIAEIEEITDGLTGVIGEIEELKSHWSHFDTVRDPRRWWRLRRLEAITKEHWVRVERLTARVVEMLHIIAAATGTDLEVTKWPTS
jgi:hypothetical protein